MNWKRTLLISLVILLIGAGFTVVIFNTEPTAKRAGATKKTAMLVDVVPVQRDTFIPEIKVMGRIQPSQDIMLSPRVSGEIIKRSEQFTPGEQVKKGELLLQIDPVDYRNILEQRKSDYQQAVADLDLELGRQDVARSDYRLIEDSLSENKRSLVLRRPQLRAVQSRVDAARSAVNQAKLDLERTSIRAPFDALILSREVNIGSQVAEGENLGRLVGMDEYWVSATVPLSHLRWLEFPEGGNERGSKVEIRNRSAWDDDQYRTGYLYKLVGTLEDETRLARVLISVPDPLALHSSDPDQPSLIIGSYVEVILQAKPLEHVVRVDRDYIRQDETVWTMNDGMLEIKEVDILFRDANYAYITEGLEDGSRVVTTNLSTVVEGSSLRTEKDSTYNKEPSANE